MIRKGKEDEGLCGCVDNMPRKSNDGFRRMGVGCGGASACSAVVIHTRRQHPAFQHFQG